MANQINDSTNLTDVHMSGDNAGDVNIMALNGTTVENNKRTLGALQTRRKQLEYFIHDLQAEKSRNERMVRSMVKTLQQEILNRGRTLAKEINQGLDDRIQDVGKTLDALNTHINHHRQEIQKPKPGDNEESTQSKCCDYEESAISLPSMDPFQIDLKQLYTTICDLRVTKQDFVDEPFPEREELVKEGVAVEVTGVGFWDSQRPTFHLMPRKEELVSFLYSHSQKIRMAYLKDKTWLTFHDSGTQPSVGSQVFACHPDDRCWYRAVVVKNSKAESTVKFVDYGETKPVSWLDLLPTRKDLYTESLPLAFECTLAEDIDPRTSQDARWFFNSTLYDIARSCVPLTCTPVKQVEVSGDTVWLVDLTVAHTDGTIMDLGREVKAKMSLSNPRSSIACRDIREEFQAQLSDIEKERLLKKAQKEKEDQQKETKTGPDGKGEAETRPDGKGEADKGPDLQKEAEKGPDGKEESSKELNTESQEVAQEVTSSGTGHVTGVSTNQDADSAVSSSLPTLDTGSYHSMGGDLSVAGIVGITDSQNSTKVVHESPDVANTGQEMAKAQTVGVVGSGDETEKPSLGTVAGTGDGTAV